MDKRKARRAGILLAILVVVPAVVLVVYLLTVARTPFTGDMHHDFGIVSVTGESTTVAYTYDLVNRTDEQLIILDVKPSCGCAAADVSTYLIDPGETLAVEAHLTLERSGLKEEAIALIMKGRGVRLVTMKAIGRRDPPIHIMEKQLRLDDDGRGHTLFTAEVWSDGTPAPPTITTPDGVLASLDSWTFDRPAEPKENRPAMWQGYVKVVWDRLNRLPADAALTISLDQGSVASVPIVTP